MKENQPITAPCQKRGASGNLKFFAFNYLCGDLTVLCSESPTFAKPQNVIANAETNKQTNKVIYLKPKDLKNG